MRTARGDIWLARADALVITTNAMRRRDGAAVMGAGIARQAAERYPGIDRRLGEQLREQGARTELLHRAGQEPWPAETRALVALPTKRDWRDPSDLGLIESGVRELAELADREGCRSVALPQPGCGLGGLDWEREARPRCERLLDERFRVIARS